MEKNRSPENVRTDFSDFYEKYESHNGLEKEDIDLLLHIAAYDTEKVAAAIQEADGHALGDRYMGWLAYFLKGKRIERC